jgi:tetratricopeptide (TPR) repeat protein
MTPSDPAPSPDDWRAALALLDALLELEPSARAAALAASDAPDAVRERVRRLLEAENASCLIDDPLVHLARDAAAVEPGTRLGRWELLARIGQGGMSTVWRARSLEEPVGQLAALKRLDPTVMDAAGLRRFEREMGILATLRHPGVATILDAGRAVDGVPWFAMTLVDGEPIDRWCAQHAPDRHARVDLIRQACLAVAHAHRHLVVHRDIKPGNVLVDGDGRVVLVDFGISRLIEETRRTDDGTDATGTYAFTPRFAAPEQRAGGAISTATDLWGLGALAHFILTDEAPLLAEGADAVVAPAALPADLRAILSRCLQRDPAERYRSADALADDLQAFLDGRAVRARGDGFAYRTGRWLRRHPAVAALSFALVLSLLGGAAASLQQAKRAEAEAERAIEAQRVAEEARQAAETEAARAMAQRRFTLSLFEASIPGRAPDELPDTRELIDQGIARARDASSGSPELRADMLLTLAEIVSARLQFKEAEALIDESATLLGGPDAAPREAWARVLLQRADLPRRQRQDAETARALDEGIAWLETEHPSAVELLEMLRDRARLAMLREDFARAEPQMLALRERLAGRRDLGSLPLRLAGDIAVLYGMQGRADEALAAHEAVLALKKADPTTSSASLATTYFNLGSAAWLQGDAAAATAHFDAALEELAPIDEPMQQRAATLAAQARMAHSRGEASVALQRIEAAADEWARALKLTHRDEDFFEAYHRGKTLADLGRRDEAIDTLKLALQRMQAREDVPPQRLGEVRTRLAALACEAGKPGDAERLLDEAARGPAAAATMALNEAQAVCALARGDAKAAVRLLEREPIRGERQQRDPDFELMRRETLRAEALLADGQLELARSMAQGVIARIDGLDGTSDHVLGARAAVVLRTAGGLGR